MAGPASPDFPPEDPAARQSRRWIGKLVGAGALTVIGVLVAAGLAPLALNERRSSEPVADTAATLPGQAEVASEGLRRLGYACSDSDVSRGVVTRVCTRVHLIEPTRVLLFVAADTGAVQLATTTVHEGRPDQALQARVLQVLADAVGLQPADRSRVLAAAATNADQLLDLGWGTFSVRSGPPAESDLRAEHWHDPPAGPSNTTLAGSVDALATAARKQGLLSTTPQIQTIRDCTRKEGGYFFDLWSKAPMPTSQRSTSASRRPTEPRPAATGPTDGGRPDLARH